MSTQRPLPFPVAAVSRQARNARSAKERHDTAYYAWELSLRLAVIGDPPADVSSLARASVGQWVGAAKLSDQPLAEPALLVAFALLTEIGTGKRSAPKNVSPRRLLDALPAYRNRVLGHAATRTEEFYDEASATLLTALDAAWGLDMFLPPNARVLYAEGVEIDGKGTRRARFLDLSEALPAVEDPRGTAIVSELLPNRIYLRVGEDRYRALHPWVVFSRRGTQEAVYFFNGLGRNAQYLDYTTGEVLDDLDRAFPGLDAELRALLKVAAEPAAEARSAATAGTGASVASPAATTPGGAATAPAGVPERLGPCRILKPLGSGAAGTVYLAEMAEDRSYARREARVAVKVINPAVLAEAGAFKRFLREAQLGAAIENAAVVRTYEADAANVDGVTYHFLVLEYVEGQTLRALISDLKVVPEALLRHLAGQIALGLEAVHAQGAVHRDVKPSNILITPDHQVKLMDMGTARLMRDAAHLTRAEQFVGTLLYAAPEQFRGEEEVGPAADLYALGVLLYEAATGLQPFAAPDFAAVMRRHLEVVPPRAGSLNPDVTPFLSEVLRCLLEKSPAARFPSAHELGVVLEEGDRSAWWNERQAALRPAEQLSPDRRIRVARETVLISREPEIESLHTAFAEAAAGHGRLVLIEGEMGVGKTRLVYELLHDLAAAGTEYQLLYGAYPPGDVRGGYAALADAVVSCLGEAGLEEKVRPLLGAMAAFAPAFAALLAGSPPPPAAEPLNAEGVHAGFCHVARALQGQKPVVCVIDDLHLGSADGRAVVLSLARIAHDQRLLVLATTESGLPADEVSNLMRAEGARKLVLGRLSPRHVIALLAAALGSDVLAERIGGRVAAKSDGNPYFVLEILRGMREAGVLQKHPDGSWFATTDITRIKLPDDIRDLMLARLKELGEDERSILDIAALQGFHFDADLVARVKEMKRLKALETLAVIERRTGIVRATGRGFRFDHPQLCETLEEALPPLLRTEYHAMLAEEYEKRSGLSGKEPSEIPGADSAFLAEHLLKAGEPLRAEPFLPRALDVLAETQRSDTLLELSAQALAALADQAQALISRVDLRLRRARCFDLLGYRDEQRRELEAAIADSGAGNVALGAVARVELGWVLLWLGEYAAAEERLLDGATRARAAGDRRTEALAHNHLGNVFLSSSRYAEARKVLEESIELAREAASAQIEGRATGNLGSVLLDTGEYEKAREHFEEQLVLARAAADRRLESNALGSLGIAYLYLCRYPESIAQYEQQVTLCREIGYRAGEAIATGNLGGVFYHLGDLGEARGCFERHLGLSRNMGYRMGEAIARANLGIAALDEARLEEADLQLAQANLLAHELGARRVESDAVHARGNLARARGDLAAAERLFEEALVLRREDGSSETLAETLVALARLGIEQGRSETARDRLLEAEGVLGEGAGRRSNPLPSCYLALLGERDARSIEVSEAAPASIRLEAYSVLERIASVRGENRAGADALLERMSAHLRGADREAFLRGDRWAAS